MIFPLASEGGCQLTMMVRGLFSLLTTVTSFGEELGTVGGGVETGDVYRQIRRKGVGKTPRTEKLPVQQRGRLPGSYQEM